MYFESMAVLLLGLSSSWTHLLSPGFHLVICAKLLVSFPSGTI